MSDLYFVQNLPEGDKIEMSSDLAFSTFKVTSILYLVFVQRGNVLGPGSPFKERDTWKGKVEPMKLEYTNLQKELVMLH